MRVAGRNEVGAANTRSSMLTRVAVCDCVGQKWGKSAVRKSLLEQSIGVRRSR